MVNNCVIGIARHEKNLDLWSQQLNPGDKFATAHSWHHDVGQHKMNRVLLGFSYFQSLFNHPSAYDPVAFSSQHFMSKLANHFIVFDEKDSF